MRLVCYLLLLVLTCIRPALATSPKPEWQPGQLVFRNGTVLSGDLNYNWQAEMVLLRETDGRIRAFSGGQVRQFGWPASPAGKARQFVSLPGSVQQMPDSPAFFEVCAEGTIQVIRRMKRSHSLFKRAYSNPIRSFDPETPDPHDSFFDYFAYVDGQFLPFRRFYAVIYRPRLSAFHRELQQYVQAHQLDDRSQFGQLHIVEQYNRLAERQTASTRPHFIY